MRDPEYSRKYALTLAKWMLYHQDNIVFDKVHWMGVRALKNPLDCWSVVMDPERERYLITYNPGGFLKRVK